jgi:hypothetical protein
MVALEIGRRLVPEAAVGAERMHEQQRRACPLAAQRDGERKAAGHGVPEAGSNR